MSLTKREAQHLKELAMTLRKSAYGCGANEHEDKRDTRPPHQRGSTHELAVATRSAMEKASEDLTRFIDSIIRKR
jgi:hypothetical protein